MRTIKQTTTCLYKCNFQNSSCEGKRCRHKNKVPTKHPTDNKTGNAIADFLLCDNPEKTDESYSGFVASLAIAETV